MLKRPVMVIVELLVGVMVIKLVARYHVFLEWIQMRKIDVKPVIKFINRGDDDVGTDNIGEQND